MTKLADLPAAVVAKLPADILAWLRDSEELKALKARELEQRLKLVAKYLKTSAAGTHVADLAKGCKLAADIRTNYALGTEKTEVALAKLAATGEVGAHLAEGLVKWSAELRVSKWNELTDDQRAFFADALIAWPGTPSLELRPPKTA